MPGVHAEYTFLSVDGDPVAELSDVRLEIPGIGRIACVTTASRVGERRFSLDGSPLALRQECVYEHDPQSKDHDVPEPHGLGAVDFSLDPRKYLTRGTWWRTWMHDSSQTALSCELLVAMARYVDLTGDERVRGAFVAAIDWYVQHTWDPERTGGIGQWNRYQRSHAHSPARISGGGGSMMFAFPMALHWRNGGRANGTTWWGPGTTTTSPSISMAKKSCVRRGTAFPAAPRNGCM